MRKLAFFILAILTFWSCEDCTGCEPFAEEPYVRIRFYHAEDTTANVVVIDSINHMWAGGYEYYQDTVHTYQLPLNMHEDVSDFTLTYRDTTDLETYFTNTIFISYEREYLKRPDNNIVVQSNITEITSNFNKTTLVCGDSLTCISNEAVYQIYR